MGYLERILAAEKWRMLTDKEIGQEYEWEYNKVEPLFGDIWPTVEDFKKDVKTGKVVEVSEAFDNQIANRSHSDSIEELKDLVSTYRFPRDVDRIVDGLEGSAQLPYPIVLKTGNHYHIMSGNTRMDAAFILGVKPKVLVVEVPEED